MEPKVLAILGQTESGKATFCENLCKLCGETIKNPKKEPFYYLKIYGLKYKNVPFYLINTPGDENFIGEIKWALKVADAAILLIDTTASLKYHNIRVVEFAQNEGIPVFIFLNKVDDMEKSNIEETLSNLNNNLETSQIPITYAFKNSDNLFLVDLVEEKVFIEEGSKIKYQDVPENFKDKIAEAKEKLMESAAESSEALMEKYFEEGSLSSEEIMQGLAIGVQAGDFVLVFCSAATSEIGITPLMDAILTLLPSPADRPAVMAQGPVEKEELTCSDSSALAAYVWKTTADPFVGKQTYFRVVSGMIESDNRYWNQDQDSEERFGTVYVPQGKDMLPVKVIHAGDLGVVPKLSETATGNTISDKAHPLILPLPEYPNALYRVAIFPKTQADSTKISPTLNRLCQEDMTLSWKNDPATRQTVLQGMGDQHIDVIIRRAKTKFQVDLLTKLPKVAYREAIRGEASAQYRHKKQSGGSGQFGEVHLKVSPSSEDFEFSNDIFGGSISSNYMPAIEKGIKAVMREGVLVGFPISGIKVSVYDGKEHPVDSKPVAFEVAGREAFKLAFMKAKPVLFEPIMMVKVTVPDENMGDILGDMNTRRARVQGMDNNKGRSVINATVPLGEMLRYTTELRSMTGGRGVFDMEFSSYEMVPTHVTKEIVAARQKELEEK